ncbi:leucine-rich repeat-containing protein 40-like isoform X3 [Portunus trituberculatus]|uniref:leucine-rich repeat-containing protein 40-like isoform X3 n=1 Tax=Portunus trituberculatus TaxID=210409 RepID=UPI001E1CCB55|nr:leucine-rich repeat-containing protein 40-like isoform X3 [Portunus trituberculatus]
MKEEQVKAAVRGGKYRIPAPASHLPARESKLPVVPLHKTLSLETPLTLPVTSTHPLTPFTLLPQTAVQMDDSQNLRKFSKPSGMMRSSQGVGRLRGRARGITRGSGSTTSLSRPGTVSSGSSRGRSSSVDEESIDSPKVLSRPKPSRYSSVRARIQVRRGRPVMRGFANVGAVFGDSKKEELHPQIVRMARRSGQLNLSNKGLAVVPEKVYRINEIDAEEAKKMTMNMTMDSSDDDRWWEQVDLTRLYLSSNQLSTLSPEISNLSALQILDLSDNNLTALPSTLGELISLQRLNLSHNQLQELPVGVFALQDLRSLQLDHNNFTTFPDDLGNLPVLEYLDVSHNSLESLPFSIGYLQRLSKFNASENEIKELPPEIGDCFALSQLDMTHNKLESLPDSIGNLRKLEQLYLRHNRLRSIPPLHSCVAMKELYLGNNFIKEMSAEQLGYLSGVSILDLRDNQMDDLPDQITLLQGLERLDITNNNLSTLPFHLGLLPHLKSMPLEGNPMRLIRRDIVQRGTVQLLKYLRSRVSAPVHTFPGFENTPADTNLLLDNSSIPDKYQMKNTQTVSYNEKVSTIPDQLFENAAEAEVRTVDLSKNVLTEVPAKFETLPACVYEMEQLEILCAANNQLKLIYVEGLSKLKRLATLDLHNNNIDFVPPQLGNVTQLRTLVLHGNPFRVPRRGILDKGTRETLEYLRSRIVDE